MIMEFGRYVIVLKFAIKRSSICEPDPVYLNDAVGVFSNDMWLTVFNRVKRTRCLSHANTGM